MKQINISFQYNPETDEITKISTTVDGVEQKKKTTKKVKEVVLESEAIIKLEETKLVLNNKAIEQLGATSDSRIIIKYETNKKAKTSIPLIGTDTAFNEEGGGNKLTKSGTVAFKGKANLFLKEFGTEFRLEPYEGIFKLISDKKEYKVEEMEEAADDIELDLIVEDDSTEIDDLTFQF